MEKRFLNGHHIYVSAWSLSSLLFLLRIERLESDDPSSIIVLDFDTVVLKL